MVIKLTEIDCRLRSFGLEKPDSKQDSTFIGFINTISIHTYVLYIHTDINTNRTEIHSSTVKGNTISNI